MAFVIGTFSRALMESATELYYGGVPVSLLDAQGNVILGDDLPDAPTVTSMIADRVYEVGAAPVTVDLRTKFAGATSYTVSPASAAVTISDYTLTINPTAAMTQTTFTVRGINGGGASAEAVTFKLTVNAPSAVLLKPFPDQSLLIGGGTVTLPLAEYFSGATTYAVSPAGQGVTISNGNLIISRAAARDVVITVTATNATGQDTADSFALVVGAPANQAPVVSGAIPAQAPVANVAFSANLASYFSDPDGDTLLFDYTGTLPTGITRNGAVFSGTATVTGQTASGVLRARDPGNLEVEAPITWAVAAQPALTAPISPITQGQQAIVTFNTLPDSPPTITQAGAVLTATRIGTTNSYNFTPLTTDPVAISALKAGYSPYNETWTVQAAPPTIVQTSANTLQAVNVDASTPDEPFIFTGGPYAGTYTAKPSTMATGPQFLVSPTQTGGTALGAPHTADLGLVLNLESGGPVAPSYRWLRGSTPIPGSDNAPYTVAAADQGQTLRLEVTAEDAKGKRIHATTGVAIPALTSLDTFTAPNGTKSRAYVGESGIGWEDKDGMKILDGKLLPDGPSSWVSHKRLDAPNALQPVRALLDLRLNSNAGAWPACRISADGLSFIHVKPFGSNLYLARSVNGVNTDLGVWTGGFVVPMAGVQCDIIPDPNGTTLRVYFDGTLRITANNVGLTTGSIGVASYGTAASAATGNGLLDFNGA